MKLIYEPTVYLMSRTDSIMDGAYRFLGDVGAPEWTTDAHGPPEAIPEIAGRLCYLSFKSPRPGGNKAYLQHILESGHGSVLEHAVWGFIVTGVSRSLTHELVRHRAGFAYSQLSQRYVDESVAEYVVPFDLQDEVRAAVKELQPEGGYKTAGAALAKTVGRPAAVTAGLEWIDGCEEDTRKYREEVEYLTKKFLDHQHTRVRIQGPSFKDGGQKYPEVTAEQKTALRKRARQAARSLLPNATETKIFVTANARAWRNGIEQRCNRHADPEIRVLFGKIWEVLVKEAPNLFGDYTKELLPDGTFELVTPYRKV